jgi:anti-sigma factor RsiW
VRPHLPEEELHSYADGALSSAQRAEIAEHLLACLICRAAEAEVEALRARTAALLELAAPRTTSAPGIARQVRPRARRARGMMVAAAVLLVGTGAVGVVRTPLGSSGATTTMPPRLATASVAPALFAGPSRGLEATSAALPDSAVDRALRSTRTLTLASHAAMAPRVVTPMLPVTTVSGRPLRAVDPMASMHPADGWVATPWAEARRATRGAIAHLAGYPVGAVRLRESDRGGRPTAMVRQLLPDGRAVWTIEGAAEEVESLTKLFAASGISMSTLLRARPDYLGTDEAPIRTIRMVAVASYLPVDSLNAMASERLRLE